MWINIVVVLAFIAILVSLGSALFFLVNDRGDSRRSVKALTWRVGLSIGLFVFIMAMIGLGLIEPHGIYPPGTDPG
jgi:hypothetical protein